MLRAAMAGGLATGRLRVLKTTNTGGSGGISPPQPRVIVTEGGVNITTEGGAPITTES